jgi:hypothetical protein
MSLRKNLLRLLSVPVHIHVPLLFRQTVYIKLATALDYYADEGYESGIGFDFQGIGAIVYVDGARNLSLNVGVGLLGLSVGTFKRFPSSGGC